MELLLWFKTLWLVPLHQITKGAAHPPQCKQSLANWLYSESGLLGSPRKCKILWVAWLLGCLLVNFVVNYVFLVV